MSIRGLTLPCPRCGDDGPFFLAKHDIDGPTFSKGYQCGVCGGYWDARHRDKLDHPDEFIPYAVRELAESDRMPYQQRIAFYTRWLEENDKDDRTS